MICRTVDLILAHCTRKQYHEFRTLLGTRSGVLYTLAFVGCAAMVGAVYSLEGLSTTQAIPLMMMVLPVLASIALVMPQVTGGRRCIYCCCGRTTVNVPCVQWFT